MHCLQPHRPRRRERRAQHPQRPRTCGVSPWRPRCQPVCEARNQASGQPARPQIGRKADGNPRSLGRGGSQSCENAFAPGEGGRCRICGEQGTPQLRGRPPWARRPFLFGATATAHGRAAASPGRTGGRKALGRVTGYRRRLEGDTGVRTVNKPLNLSVHWADQGRSSRKAVVSKLANRCPGAVPPAGIKNGAHGTRQAADLPRGGPRGREDVRHARRGAAAAGPGHRCGGRLRGAPQSEADGRDDRRSGDRLAPGTELPGRRVQGDGPRRDPAPQARRRAGGRARPHQCARLSQRQALGGRRGAARSGYRRRLHRQHPAPGVARRRGRGHHRCPAARDCAGRGGPPGRPDRAGRHVPAGAAPPPRPRQRLRAREDRRGARQLLPPRQPHRPA